ncbi:TM2 domain-containing protein [Nocardia pseudobrasiliensis]|uniref:TM2 domain-containing membrane protein YozV n=1 Tax=Nocardia pseudobrasiliensis TaxID=45979 RepID=A0A370I4A9_9NOCA|nr:TM2 domain-containing protein [Nocardia pseudobrasiliensis]RDI65440.1 TM2 domain-containing membrane protein YozV [Nocardia pseudobrasiliensis]
MTDPYQQQPGYGPQFGPAGTGPGVGGPQDAQQPYAQPYAYPQAPVPPGVDPNAPYGRNIYGEPYSDKSKLVAGLLQIFLGWAGVGRFYLGYPALGVAQLVVSVLTCGVGHIWGIIDGVLILTGKVRDPNGLPLQEN